MLANASPSKWAVASSLALLAVRISVVSWKANMAVLPSPPGIASFLKAAFLAVLTSSTCCSAFLRWPICPIAAPKLANPADNLWSDTSEVAIRRACTACVWLVKLVSTVSSVNRLSPCAIICYPFLFRSIIYR